MVKKIDQGIIIILDIGKNVAGADGKDEESFFKQARDCAARIVERKILSQGNNFLGLILLGSEKTMNNMADQCGAGFGHIETFFKMQPPVWKMIRDMPQSPTLKSGDWLEALEVAVHHVKNEVCDVKIVKMKIILITNFESHTCSEKKAKMVLNMLQKYKYEVDIFGPDIYDEHNKNIDIRLARDFINQTNGQTATFAETMHSLLFHKGQAVKPTPWYVDLSIGTYIRIPINAYVRIDANKNKKKRNKNKGNDPSSSKSTNKGAVGIEKGFYNAEDQSKVDQTNVTKVYKIGHQIVPASKSDESMFYKSGIKSLSLYGFTFANNVHWQHLDGKGLHYVFGRKGNKNAQQAIACLIEILHKNNYVGIARKVHYDDSDPKMCVLMPVIDTNNYMCLSMVSLCYKDSIKQMLFPRTNTKKYSCTNNQVNAMKDLIKAMNLDNAYDETFDNMEAFPIGETESPSAQYMFDCLAYRALNPDKPLPPPRDDIMNLFKIPPLVVERSHKPLEKIKTLFFLQKIRERKQRRKMLLDFGEIDKPVKSDQNNPLNSTCVSKDKCSISTINPVRDFSTLMNEGKTLSELAPEMTEVIESLLYYNLDGVYSKGLAAMTLLRNECVKHDPSQYNNWLQKFKVDLSNRNRNDLHNLIKEKGLDFILKSENSLSLFETVTSHEESQLCEVDTVPESTEMLIDSDVDAMFDEM